MRWRQRPRLAATLRAVVVVAPVLLSVVAAWAVSRALPPVTGLGSRFWHLAVLVAVSSAALVAVDRVLRRLLPLVTLLELSMLFPEQAPSRIKVAREAARRRPIEEQLARVRDAGADPAAVAAEVLGLVAALSAHDSPTRGHAERVRMFTDLVAEELGLAARDRDHLRWAAILHDVGKLRVPAALLNKPGKPTADEWVVLRAHPLHGAEIASALLPWLGEWAAVIVEHHERYDGTGYPHGLAGPGISLGARIVSVADAYDVMTAARAYKRPVSRAAALKELVRHSGTQFDPDVVRAMVSVGAPRLRRAQGILAWLADIPLVAGAVPASTVARVVGTGAVAAGAVTAPLPALPGQLPAPPRSVATVSTVAADRSGAVASAGRPDGERPVAGATAVPSPSGTALTGSAHADRSTDPAVPAGGADDGSGGAQAPGPTAGSEAGAAGSGSAGAGGTGTSGGTSGSPDGSSSGGGTSRPRSTTDPVGDVLDTVTGTVGSTTADPVGTVTDVVDGVTGTVTGTVTDPVGTVTGTVSDPVGTVTGILGGSGSNSGPGSTSSGSGSSGSGSNSGPGSTSSGSGSSGSGSSGSGSLLGSLTGR